MKSRRSLLAAAVPLLAGGCIGESPATEQSPTPVSETEQPIPSPTDKPASPSETPDCMRGYTVYVSSFAPTTQLVTEFRPAQQRLIDRIFAEDGVVLRTYGQRPIRTEQYTLHNEAYYRIDYEQTDSEEVQAHRADVSWEKGQEAPADESVVNYSDIPEADQHALEHLIRGPKYSREQHPTQSLSVGGNAPYPQGSGESELVGAGTMRVKWNDRVYEVTISTEEGTITRRTFNYTATRVADSEVGFRKYAADRYCRQLEDLSSEEKSVIEEAINADEYGKYEDCNEPSEGYQMLKQRLEDESDLPDPLGDHWYISYDGERYLVEITGWVV